MNEWTGYSITKYFKGPVMYIPYKRQCRHQIRHSTIQILNTVIFNGLSVCHFRDKQPHWVRTVLVHIHYPVPCVVTLNTACRIMECPVCMLQHTAEC
jgi:hypothetical protein